LKKKKKKLKLKLSSKIRSLQQYETPLHFLTPIRLTFLLHPCCRIGPRSGLSENRQVLWHRNRGKLQTFFRHLLLFKCIQTMTIQPDENGRTFGESLPYQNSPKLLLAAHVSFRICKFRIFQKWAFFSRIKRIGVLFDHNAQ
jgi:hypothetical protein